MKKLIITLFALFALLTGCYTQPYVADIAIPADPIVYQETDPIIYISFGTFVVYDFWYWHPQYVWIYDYPYWYYPYWYDPYYSYYPYSYYYPYYYEPRFTSHYRGPYNSIKNIEHRNVIQHKNIVQTEKIFKKESIKRDLNKTQKQINKNDRIGKETKKVFERSNTKYNKQPNSNDRNNKQYTPKTNNSKGNKSNVPKNNTSRTTMGKRTK